MVGSFNRSCVLPDLAQFWESRMQVARVAWRVSKIYHYAMTRNGSADGDQIWCVFRDQLAMHIIDVMDVVHTSAGANVHTCRCAPSPYLGNSWTNCAEIWCVVRGPLTRAPMGGRNGPPPLSSHSFKKNEIKYRHQTFIPFPASISHTLTKGIFRGSDRPAVNDVRVLSRFRYKIRVRGNHRHE